LANFATEPELMHINQSFPVFWNASSACKAGKARTQKLETYIQVLRPTFSVGYCRNQTDNFRAIRKHPYGDEANDWEGVCIPSPIRAQESSFACCWRSFRPEGRGLNQQGKLIKLQIRPIAQSL
jgi:hypothetical protein